MKDRIIKTTEFYKTHSNWIKNHNFDEYGRPCYMKYKDKNKPINGFIKGKFPTIFVVDNNNRSHTIVLHKLIATLFIENPSSKPFVIHIDGDPLNYSLENLQWGDFEDRTKNIKERLGDKRSFTKRVIATNKHNGEIKEFTSCKELAQFLGITGSAVTVHIKNNKPYGDWDVRFVTPQKKTSNRNGVFNIIEEQ